MGIIPAQNKPRDVIASQNQEDKTANARFTIYFQSTNVTDYPYRAVVILLKSGVGFTKKLKRRQTKQPQQPPVLIRHRWTEDDTSVFL